MDAKDSIRSSFNLSSMVLKTYISDMEDADLMRRPGEGCNHLAWQLGHLISSEVQLTEMVAPGKGAQLPDGFAEAHSKEQCGNDDAAAFADKDTYVELFDKVRQNSLTVLENLSEDDLNGEGPEPLRQVCPTVGDFFNLVASHPMMHAGQFVVVRRQLGKPILM